MSEHLRTSEQVELLPGGPGTLLDKSARTRPNLTEFGNVRDVDQLCGWDRKRASASAEAQMGRRSCLWLGPRFAMAARKKRASLPCRPPLILCARVVSGGFECSRADLAASDADVGGRAQLQRTPNMLNHVTANMRLMAQVARPKGGRAIIYFVTRRRMCSRQTCRLTNLVAIWTNCCAQAEHRDPKGCEAASKLVWMSISSQANGAVKGTAARGALARAPS